MSNSDTDQTSGGVLLLPDQAGATLHELIQVGKNGRIEVINRDDLGGFNLATTMSPRDQRAISGLWSTPAYWNGSVYFWGNGDRLKQFALVNGQLSLTPTASASVSSGFPGASPVISANGTGNASYGPSAPTVTPQTAPRFFTPTKLPMSEPPSTTARKIPAATSRQGGQICRASGNQRQVYVGAQSEVDVFGLIASSVGTAPTPAFTPTPGVYASSQTVTILAA